MHGMPLGDGSAAAATALQRNNSAGRDIGTSGPFIAIVGNQPKLDASTPLHSRKLQRDRPGAFGMPLFATERQKHHVLDATRGVRLDRKPKDQPVGQIVAQSLSQLLRL